MGLRIFALTSVLVLTACTGSANRGKSNTQLTGEDLFIQRCASCHGVDGGLQASASPDIRETSLSNYEIMEMIDKGGNGMPAFKTIISSSKEKKKIVDHVLTLRK